MTENMKKFMELLETDELLRRRLMEQKNMKRSEAIENAIAFAQEKGIALSEADFMHDGEMSDEELDMVAGGGMHADNGALIVSSLYSCDLWTTKHGTGEWQMAGKSCLNCRHGSFSSKAAWFGECRHTSNGYRG